MRKKMRKIFEILTQHTSKVGSSTLKMGTEIKSNTYLVFFLTGLLTYKIEMKAVFALTVVFLAGKF